MAAIVSRNRLLIVFLAAAVGAAGLPGLHKNGAARFGSSAEEARGHRAERKRKAEADFDPIKLTILPQKTDGKEIARRLVKPGHWTAAVEETKANNFDFTGQLFAEARAEALGPAINLPPNALSIGGDSSGAIGKGTTQVAGNAVLCAAGWQQGLVGD